MVIDTFVEIHPRRIKKPEDVKTSYFEELKERLQKEPKKYN